MSPTAIPGFLYAIVVNVAGSVKDGALVVAAYIDSFLK
jgi:hypothetical protein